MGPRGSDAGLAGRIEIEPATAAVINEVIGQRYAEYLGRRGKSRWCDKSLDNAVYAPLLAQVFPDAQFICLYRHCLDVIDSGLEASPWGLLSFGFTQHAVEFPGNSIAAIGHYWLVTTRAITEFESLNPGRCLRVRYEDLVSAPEQTANSVFAFLGEQSVAGIGEMCLRAEHESHGASDQKIWFTDRIVTTSVGRGERLPVAALPPPLREEIDNTLVELGYSQVGQEHDDPAKAPQASAGSPPAACSAMAETIAAILTESTEDKRSEVVERWPSLVGREVEIGVGETWREAAFIGWRFSPGQVTVIAASRADRTDGARLRMLAGVGTWRALLAGEANMAIELVAARVRLDPHDEQILMREAAVFGLCVLLGISHVWSFTDHEAAAVAAPPPGSGSPPPVPPAAPGAARRRLKGALMKIYADRGARSRA